MSASISPVSRPSKKGTPSSSRARRSSKRARTGAENSSGAHGIRRGSGRRRSARSRRGRAGKAREPTASDAARHGVAPLVPAVEGREIARVPGLAQPWGAQVPVGADLAHDIAQVVPEVDEGGAPPEP